MVDLIASRCTELESGGRMVDAILTQTLLPEISRELLTRLMEGRSGAKNSGDSQRREFCVRLCMSLRPSETRPVEISQLTSIRKPKFMALSQTNRLLQVTTPLGESALVVTGFRGTEQISQTVLL